MPSVEEIGPSELLGHLLFQYQQSPAGQAILDASLPQQYVYTRSSRRLADRVIWTGLGGFPDVQADVPTIAVEFVSGDIRDRRRDYVDKRRQYADAGIHQYWIFDRFQRALTVIDYLKKRQMEQVVTKFMSFESSFLPGFELPVGRILENADSWANAQTRVTR
jgi:Uma2 family endonuclease